MKKIIALFFVLIISLSAFSVLFASEYVAPVKAETQGIEKHLILNKDGSYGGTLDEQLYGKGTPKNGELDVINSPYFTVNDFYNMTSTDGAGARLLFPNFKPYQQTMANSSAFACLVMMLNYLDKDVENTYSELALVKQFEQINSVTVKDCDVSKQMLESFITSLDSSFKIEKSFSSRLDDEMIYYLSERFEVNLSESKFMFVRFQSPADFGWKLVIGIDKMGTEDELDDTLILANPFDVSDHYQDGYSTFRLGTFNTWWQDVKPNGEASRVDEMVIVDTGKIINFVKEERDTTPKQTHYELHHILNADGSYGGTRDKEKYGSISTKDGSRNVLYSNYYKINDYYNMKDEGSRLILENYNTYQQTMSASCGICSMMSVLNYFGHDIDESWEVTLCEKYYPYAKRAVYPKGTLAEYNVEVLKEYGLKAQAMWSNVGEAPLFPTYESYRDFMKENLEKDLPVMISAKPRGGHWIVVIGLDDMGTENIYDDVIITSDSSDTWDHYQDGYNTYSATHLYRIHFNKDVTRCYSLIRFEKNVSAGAIIAIVAGGVLLVAGGAFFATYYFKKKQRKLKISE